MAVALVLPSSAGMGGSPGWVAAGMGGSRLFEISPAGDDSPHSRCWDIG